MEYDKQESHSSPIQSGDLYREALKEKENSDRFYYKVYQAMNLRLQERGSVGDLAEKEAKNLLIHLEQVRFGGKGGDNLAEEVKRVFEKLR